MGVSQNWGVPFWGPCDRESLSGLSYVGVYACVPLFGGIYQKDPGLGSRASGVGLRVCVLGGRNVKASHKGVKACIGILWRYIEII